MQYLLDKIDGLPLFALKTLSLFILLLFYLQGNATQREMMSGLHNWYTCSHARPTYCNVCREALSGVTSHGLSCEGEFFCVVFVVF